MTEYHRKKAQETVDYTIDYTKKGIKCAVDNVGESAALVTWTFMNALWLHDLGSQVVAWHGFSGAMQDCIRKAQDAEKTAVGSLPKADDTGN